MGYSAFYFQHAVQGWLDAGWLKPGGRLIDFGSQEFSADPAETRQAVTEFLCRHGVDLKPGQALPSIKSIYAAAGITYTAIDVDGARESTFFDLNTFATPPDWRGAFDFVNNEGTIEHLANPINGFNVAHDMARVGGVIRHNFPLTGWTQHGFNNPTPKFYAHLIGDNAYEVLTAVATVSEPTPLNDPIFTRCYAEGRSDGLTNDAGVPLPAIIQAPLVTNIWGHLVYRKTSDRPFVLPIDHVEGPDLAAVRGKMVDNYRRSARS
jgi:hypothetical protein